MRQHLSGIDHAVVATPDLDAAAAQYKALGFHLTPRGEHTVGSVNHCIMFRGGDYFELFGVPQGARVAQAFETFLAHGPGLVSVVFGTDDVLGAKTELSDAGIQAGEVRDFSRTVDLPGATGQARFRTLDMPATLTPGLHVFCCQHYTRELVWTPESQDHPNGVQAIHSVVLCSPEPQRTIDAYARLLDRQSVQSGGIHQITMGGAALCVGDEATLDALYPGIATGLTHARPCGVGVCFQVVSINALKQLLVANRVGFTALSPTLIKVDAACAQGVSILFRQ